MLDFRPFAGSYVSNTYEEFSKKAEAAGFLGRNRSSEAEPLFTYSPSEQDVREQQQRFQDLQQHVLRQRLQIKAKDQELTRFQQLRRELEGRKWKETQAKRKTFMVQLRAFSSGRGERESQPKLRVAKEEKARKTPRNLQTQQGKTLPQLRGKLPQRDLSAEAKGTAGFYITEAYN